MSRKAVVMRMLVGLLLLGLTACAAGESQEQELEQTVDATLAEDDAEEPTPTMTGDLAEMLQSSATMTQTIELGEGVSGIGSVEAHQDADLVFVVGGTVQDVYVEEGDMVTAGQVLTSLDVRTYDYQIQQAEAALLGAQAQYDALFDAPKEADIWAADVQIRQAEASLAKVLEPPEEVDVRSAQATLEQAQTNLQATKDRLSHAKTQANLQVKQAVYQLTQAQWAYALQQRHWEHADDEGTDPIQPATKDPMSGKDIENDLTEGQEAGYHTQYEQAKAAMQQAEEVVEQAVMAAEGARKAEVTGVMAAEKQVVQAQAALDKVLLDPNENDVAQAQAGVDLAQANRERLYPAPSEARQTQAVAGIRQAQASLDLAQLNREYSELYAPFDGMISEVNINPGDPGSTTTSGNNTAIKIVDMSRFHIDVDISDVDISKIAIGQPATAYADALPGQTFTGRVSYIAPQADVVGNIRTYVVRVVLDEWVGLRPGMSVRVEIEPKK